jgi:hypothetical protein
VKNNSQQALSSPRREEVILESELIIMEELVASSDYKEKGFPGSLYLG